MTKEQFNKALAAVELWQEQAREDGEECMVIIHTTGGSFKCRSFDLLDYCVGCGEFNGDAGYNTGDEICLINLASITAVQAYTTALK